MLVLAENHWGWSKDPTGREPSMLVPNKEVKSLIEEFNKEELKITSLPGFLHIVLHFTTEEDMALFRLSLP